MQCPDCGSVNLSQIEHHGEVLKVCSKCGTTVKQDLANLAIAIIPAKKITIAGVKRNRSKGYVLPSQPDGFVAPKLSTKRKEILRLLGTFLSSSTGHTSPTSSVWKQAHHLARSVNLVGLQDNAVVAAVSIASLKSHRQDFSFREICKRADASLGDTNKALKALTVDVESTFTCIREPLRTKVELLLEGSSFYRPDGSDFENELNVKETETLISFYLQKKGTPNIHVDSALIIASSFICYMKRDVIKRGNLTLESFIQECDIQVENLDLARTKKSKTKLLSWIRDLVKELPFVQLEARGSLRAKELLPYLDDLYEQNTKPSTQQNIEEPDCKPCITEPHHQVNSTEQQSEESLSHLDQDIDGYLRTEKEVAALKPMFLKVHGNV